MSSKTINSESKSRSIKTTKTDSGRAVHRSSKASCLTQTPSSNKKSEISESDKLTLRAWKHTYANHRKTED